MCTPTHQQRSAYTHKHTNTYMCTCQHKEEQTHKTHQHTEEHTHTETHQQRGVHACTGTRQDGVHIHTGKHANTEWKHMCTLEQSHPQGHKNRHANIPPQGRVHTDMPIQREHKHTKRGGTQMCKKTQQKGGTHTNTPKTTHVYMRTHKTHRACTHTRARARAPKHRAHKYM